MTTKRTTFDISKRICTLNNGVQMPIIGLGTYQMKGSDCRSAVTESLRLGYRMFDSAAYYRNEEDIAGEIKRISQQPEEINLRSFSRNDVFITTKLAPVDHGYESTLAAFERSRKALNVDVIDLYLIHWPGKPAKVTLANESLATRQESWRAMEHLYKAGKVKAIGVSNYTVRHLQELLDTCSVVPAVVQNEIHPYLFPKDWYDFCRSKGIQIEAYSSLGEGLLLKDPVVTKIAQAKQRTVAQVLLRWAIQHEMIVIPKSVTHSRLAENFNLFDFSLTATEMSQLDALHRDKHVCWNPDTIE